MAFESFGAFLWMEGHGPYVWVCFLVFTALLGGQMIWSRQRHHRVMRNLHRQNLRTDDSPRQGRSAAAPASFTPVQTSEHEKL